MTARIDAQTVGRVLAEIRVGRDHATPGHVIAARLGIARLRTIGEVVAFERARRYRTREPQILGDGRGYWIAEGAAEMERPRRTIRRRALGCLLAAKYLDPELYERAQQVLAFLQDDGAALALGSGSLGGEGAR